jgi:hypothetical protein
MWEPTSGAEFCGVNKKVLRRSSNLEIMFYGFPKEKKHIWENSRKDGLVHSRCNITYLINYNFFFVDNFEPNPILVNVNELKPYTYVDQTMKGIQSLKDQKSSKTIKEDHMEEIFDED